MFKFLKKHRKLFTFMLTVAMISVFFAISCSAAGISPAALAANPSEAFINLIETMLSVLGDCITNLMTAIKDGFMSLVFVDPVAETLQVSAVGIWLFVMLGLSLALSLGYYIIGILHRRG